MNLRTTSVLTTLSCLAIAVGGCSSDKDPMRTGSGVFESDAPGATTNGRGVYAEDASATAPTTNGNVSTAGSAGDVARTIEEADIVKIEGNRLYALSQYGGLSIIDISTRDHMRLLGRQRVQAQPFEMYVRDQVVLALYNGYGEYVKGPEEGQWRWVTTSYVMAFDTSDPSHPTTVGRFSIPGTIQDSRLVGNALYVVGFESGGCWECDDGQHTTVLSLDVTTPSAIRQVDRRSYADNTTDVYSWKRSIAVTDKRMYIAGPEYGVSGTVGSTIQVVDISDPSGKLVDGVQISAAGRIDSRWQMDETDQVLRVISQPGNWRPADAPRIQTFAVESAQAVTKLASVDMAVPANESLRSVRFDGPRGYAITAVQTDPLFTIDFTNAAAPKQVGELVMPGWVYYMEPRGERVLGLGYDQGNAAGALAVSLFDVSNLATPRMLSRVNFGGDWSWMVEDQDRIHKAFQVLDSANLVLMPFSGSVMTSDGCYGGYVSGVQLIDWANDALTLRGVAPTVGQARRGLLHDSRLLTMSDERVEAFDIVDRSQPKATDSLKLTHKVSQTVDAGTAIVKVVSDWYSNSVSLDTTTLAAVEDPSSLGHVDVKLGSDGCRSWSNLEQVLGKDGKLYLIVNDGSYDSSTNKSIYAKRLITVDVSLPESPKVLGEGSLDFGTGWNYWYNRGLVAAGQTAVLAGDAIVALGGEEIYEYDSRGAISKWSFKTKVYVVDPANPSKPKVTLLEMPTNLGTTGLLPSGSTVGFGHYVTSPTNSARVRFYLDRLDVSDPSHPVLQAGVNVPGSPVAFDAVSSNVVTVDYRDVIVDGITSGACYEKYRQAWFEYKNNDYGETAVGTCHTVQQTLYLAALSGSKAIVMGSQSLAVGDTVSNVAVGNDRVFLTIGNGYGYYATNGMGVATVDCMDCGYGYSTLQQSELPLVVVGGLGTGSFAIGQTTLAGGDYWSYSPMVASGQRVLLSTGWRGKLTVVDGSDVENPAVVRQTDVYGTTQSLTAVNGIGIASLYYDGVQTLRIAD